MDITLEQTDAALYDAKENGTKSVCLFEPGLLTDKIEQSNRTTQLQPPNANRDFLKPCL